MKKVQLNISPLHAETVAMHLLLVLKNFVSGKPAGSIPEERVQLLERIDSLCQKLNELDAADDDESPRLVMLTIPEAEAFLKAFTDADLKAAALSDDFYQKHSYTSYFVQIYAQYLKEVSAAYVEALAA